MKLSAPPFLLSGLVVLGSLLAGTISASARVLTLLEASAPGPTVLIVNLPAPDDVSGTSALKQAAAWQLTKGKVVVAEEADLTDALEATAPTAVVILEVKPAEKNAGPANRLQVRGGNAAVLLKTLNGLLDPGTAPLELAEVDAAFPPTPAGATVVKVSFLSGGERANLGERIRLFRHAVHQVLAANAMTPSSPWTLLPAGSAKIKAAIYAGGGTSINRSLSGYPASLDPAAAEIDYTYVGPVELAQPKALDQFDVLIVGGGSGSKEAKAIGEPGAAAIKAFIQRGGGYVSSCAGSYLATCNYPWSLKIVAAKTVDSAHWARGTGQVDIELTDAGRSILGAFNGLQSCRYANGPLLGEVAPPDGLGPYTVLAYFRSDMAKGRNTPKGLMPNSPAIIAGEYGQGRVLCCSPHPEYTAELKSMIPRAVKWAAKRAVQ